MKALLFVLLAFLAFTTRMQSAVAQQLQYSVNSPAAQAKVDSTFTTNFILLENRLHHHEQPNSDERTFMYVCDLMSDLNSFTVANYFIEFILNETGLKETRKWYTATRTRIEWLKLQRGINILNSIPKTMEEVEQQQAELEALRIK